MVTVLHFRLEARPRGFPLGETVAQFTQRLQRVAEKMNSPAFAGAHGRGLPGLSTQMLARCRWVVKNKGQRYLK